MKAIRKDLHLSIDKNYQKTQLMFFKTGPGQYGYGDKFLGIRTPDVRLVAKKYWEVKLDVVSELLKSPYHEERLLAALILVFKYEKSKTLNEKKNIFNFFVKNKKGLNNWDLVDQTTYKILGHYCYHTKDIIPIIKLAASREHWSRRIAIVSTLYFIKNGEIDIIYLLAPNVFKDQEDLMHKALGWMLREAGKKDMKKLEEFLKTHIKKIPRTTLRYAIEKMPESKRTRFLKLPH